MITEKTQPSGRISWNRGKRDPVGRYRAKWQLVHNLYQIGYNAKQVCEMFGLIDGMMHLRVDLEEPFEQELDDLEESLQMPCPIQNRST